MKITKNDFAFLKEQIEIEKENRIEYDEIKYNYCPSYWRELKDYSKDNSKSCGQDIEDCFLCWSEELTDVELNIYNKLKEGIHNGNK